MVDEKQFEVSKAPWIMKHQGMSKEELDDRVLSHIESYGPKLLALGINMFEFQDKFGKLDEIVSILTEIRTLVTSLIGQSTQKTLEGSTTRSGVVLPPARYPCNNCGGPIAWPQPYNGGGPLNLDGTPHRCRSVAR